MDIEDLRVERRSFSCPNTLWKELLKRTDDCIPVSEFIREAIEEKLSRETEGFPEKQP